MSPDFATLRTHGTVYRRWDIEYTRYQLLKPGGGLDADEYGPCSGGNTGDGEIDDVGQEFEIPPVRKQCMTMFAEIHKGEKRDEENEMREYKKRPVPAPRRSKIKDNHLPEKGDACQQSNQATEIILKDQGQDVKIPPHGQAEKAYEVKRIGKHWLVGSPGKRFQRLRVPDNATVSVCEHFVLVDEEVYEINENDLGNIKLLKVEDVPLNNAQHVDVFEISERQKLVIQNKSDYSKQLDTSSFVSEDGDVKLRLTECETNMKSELYPLNIIYEDGTATDENEEESNDQSKTDNDMIVDKKRSTFHSIPRQEPDIDVRKSDNPRVDIEDKYSSRENNGCTEQSETDKPTIDYSVELASDETTIKEISTKEDLEMGNTEEAYDSLETGNTEETNVIQTFFVKPSKGADKVLLNKDGGNSFTMVTDTIVTDLAGENNNLRQGGNPLGQQKEKIKIIKDVAEQVWEILKEEKKQQVEDFEELNGSITHEKDILTLIGNDFKGNDDSFDDYANVFESFVKELKNFEFQDIPIDDELLDRTPEWISELNGTFNQQCIIFIPMQKKVIALFDSYDKWKQIEHFFLVKQGKRKQIGKRRGGATGSCLASIQPSDATRPEEKRTYLDLGKDAKGRKTYKTAEGMQVYVYEANILKLDVQCIVTAANDTLSHCGGVGAVIARSAGYKLTEECNFFIKRNRKLPVGSVCTTSAGHLQYKAVIHAVGPCWSDYGRSVEEMCRCEDDLFSAIYESCVEAERNKFKSVAFPAISSAIFGVPEDLCVCEYVKATLAFSKTWPRSLTEIHFIDKNPAIIGRIQREFKTVLEDCQESPYQRSVYVRKGKRHGRRYQTNQGVDTTKYNKTSHSPVPSIQKEVLPTGHNEKDVCGNASVSNFYRFDRDKETKLYVNKGDILRLEPCVAVVVTLNEDGRGGALASGVAAEMQVNSRDRYKRDIKKRLTGKLKVGQIALTDGYASRFSHIIHVVLPLSERKQQPHIRRLHLCDVYRNIFTEVSKERDVNAIATTLIGIGHTTDEIDLGCGAFLDGYLSYLNEQLPEGCSHPNVYLVCAEQNVFDRVCETFNSHFEKVTNTEQCHDSRSRSKEPHEMGTREEQDCVICMDKVTIPRKLACGHIFCTDCIDKYFEVKKACPTCGTVCCIITGDQPPGNISINYSSRRCSGYPECGQISIIYTFPSGRQQENHPNPGSWYDGITRTAYLPDNEEGRKILKMLQIAFERKLVFTIGRSRTTGKEGVIIWNDIHHKTDPRPNTQFGYPDATYLPQVKEELAAKGVTEDDIKKQSHYL